MSKKDKDEKIVSGFAPPPEKVTTWRATQAFTVCVARGIPLAIEEGAVAQDVIDQLSARQLEGLQANGKLVQEEA